MLNFTLDSIVSAYPALFILTVLAAGLLFGLVAALIFCKDCREQFMREWKGMP